MIEGWGKVRHPTDGVMNCTYTALRKPKSIFVSWSEGGLEYYDLKNDPFQLQNSVADLEDGDRDQLLNQLRGFRGVDQTTTTISTLPNEAIRGRKLQVDGFVEDNSSVAGVEVLVQSVDTKRFWNGESWQAKRVHLDARLNAPSRPISSWTYQVDLSDLSEAFDGRNISITAIGYDTKGSRAATEPTFIELRKLLLERGRRAK